MDTINGIDVRHPSWSATGHPVASSVSASPHNSGEQRGQVVLSPTPADIAAVAAFLASDEAGWLTGESLAVSGGLR